MKKNFLLTSATIVVGLMMSPKQASAQVSTLQSTWAVPYITDVSGTRLPSSGRGSTLFPNTTYYLVLEATAPINPNLGLIQIKSADRFTNIFPYGLDVPSGGFYRRTFIVTTDSFSSPDGKVRITYNGSVGEIDPLTGLATYRDTYPVQTAILP